MVPEKNPPRSRRSSRRKAQRPGGRGNRPSGTLPVAACEDGGGLCFRFRRNIGKTLPRPSGGRGGERRLPGAPTLPAPTLPAPRPPNDSPGLAPSETWPWPPRSN
ncbi:translation initiation factor IF-2-like [Artibeus jamaicensis]|uniref:translation initiation factor IF-2-like n=1 Tax=Artibeus jamaicensis TaxID=9417 RepID=UPI00187C2D47|nr:translation initiation factor IF-2-like [Artibeus jamaicensis]